MTREQLEALMEYIDARISERIDEELGRGERFARAEERRQAEQRLAQLVSKGE